MTSQFINPMKMEITINVGYLLSSLARKHIFLVLQKVEQGLHVTPYVRDIALNISINSGCFYVLPALPFKEQRSGVAAWFECSKR